MAFASGHIPPANFTAGQLKDGASFGLIDVPNYKRGVLPSKFKIDLRYYKNTLIILGSRQKADGTVVEPPAIVSADWINSIKYIIQPTKIPSLSTLSALVPNAGEIMAVGLRVGGLVPIDATGDWMPYEQLADGNIKAILLHGINGAAEIKQPFTRGKGL